MHYIGSLDSKDASSSSSPKEISRDEEDRQTLIPLIVHESQG